MLEAYRIGLWSEWMHNLTRGIALAGYQSVRTEAALLIGLWGNHNGR